MKQFAEKWANVLKVADQPEANEEKWIKNAVLWMKKKWRKRSRRRRRRRKKRSQPDQGNACGRLGQGQLEVRQRVRPRKPSK